jgi:DNA-binding transcriptional regulator PaaX
MVRYSLSEQLIKNLRARRRAIYERLLRKRHLVWLFWSLYVGLTALIGNGTLLYLICRLIWK